MHPCRGRKFNKQTSVDGRKQNFQKKTFNNKDVKLQPNEDPLHFGFELHATRVAQRDGPSDGHRGGGRNGGRGKFNRGGRGKRSRRPALS